VVKEKTMAKLRPQLALEQGRFVGTYDPTEEVMLTLTVPLARDLDVFRVGWSLKGLGRTGWIAISTGAEVWSTREMGEAAEHITHMLEACLLVVRGEWVGPRD
jgi:hypothetical protein